MIFRKMLFFFASAVLLPFCSSKETSCTVDATSGGTRYRVPKFTASHCLYCWTNETDHVLASKDGKLDELVMSSNITEIVTYKCNKVMKYRRSCIPQKKTTTATCSTTCTGTVEDQDEDGKTNDKENSIPTTTTIVIAVVVPALLLLIIIVTIGIMVYRRNRRMKERYPAVNKNQPADDEDVSFLYT